MRTGTVTSYVKKSKDPAFFYAPGTYPGPDPIKIYNFFSEDNTYEMTDTSMEFDLMEKDENGNTIYLISGTTAKIHFNTGDLAGFEMEVLDYDHDTKTFQLIPYTDQQGTLYPNATLYPKPGDEYKILDINIPQSYIDDAEARLSTAANDYLNDLMARENTYTVETKSNQTYGGLYPGWKVSMIDDDLGISNVIRIIDLTTNIYTDVTTFTLSDWVNKPKIKQLTDAVNNIEAALEKAKLPDANKVQGNAQTTAEVKNMLIDPIDGKLKAIEVIRRKTIDPDMLAPAASILGYSIQGALVEPNVGGDPNAITINAGTFHVHEFYSVDRPTIKTIQAIEL
jgi:hypothetical protein